MYKKTVAFTLLEIMVGVFIFSTMTLMFFYVVRSSSKESTFSGNHFSAIMIGQKVAEDIMEEYFLNPYAEESLGLNTSLAQKTGIIDGQSVFFMALEDTQPPWGKIESSKDGGINKFQEPLYSQMKSFLLSSKVKPDYPGGFYKERNNIQKVNLTISWANAIDKGKTEKTFFVFAPREAKKYADPIADIDYAALGVEDAIKSLLPNGTDLTKPLSEILSSLDANKKLIFNLAATQILCANFVKSDAVKKLTRQVRECESKLAFVTDKKEEFELKLRIAKNWYQVARLSFNVVAAIAKNMVPVAENEDSQDAFTQLNPFKLQLSYMDIKIIYRYFLDAMIAARFYYQKLLTSEMAEIAGQKRQLDIIIRLFDLYRILSFAPGHVKGKTEYENFISRVKEMSAWKNQSLYRFADQEKKLSENLTILMEKFPNLKPVHQILAVQIPIVFSFIANQP